MIDGIRQGLKDDRFEVPLTKHCRRFCVARRSVYDKPSRTMPKVNPAFMEPIKALIEEEPSFGYLTVAHLLGFNKNTVQRIFQLKGWQVRNGLLDIAPA